jgi:hypothetical protein
MIIALIVYLVLSIIIAYLGKLRTVGFMQALVISILLTPIVGLIVVINSSKLILYHIVQHECPECGYSFDSKHDQCPLCVKEGKQISLRPTIIPTT